MSRIARGLCVATMSYCLMAAAPSLAEEFALSPQAPPEQPTLTPQTFTLAAARAIAPIADTASGAQDEMEAEAPASDFTFSGNVALATQYRFRGVNLSGSELALQGGFDVVHASGFYAGTWASTLDNDTVGYGSLELDLYGGWSGPLSEGLTADVGFIAYTYPDAPAGNFDYYEVFANLAFTLGPAATTVGVNYDPKQDGLDFGGLTRDNLYIYTDVGIGIPDTPVTINAHLGYTDGSLTFTNNSKSWDWSIGASVPLVGPLTASVAYIDAEADVATGAFNPTSSAVVGILSATF
ncbi:TorF family putative porin [Erythrobacter dokdonensis]|uniref:Gcw_chp domain-containing protein n=1 Tax=Erythrobacter dokdonensis DSW-74 TaxID=1300349 RepID=A0A1A7BJG9_9SPHN|nr:TorF family putative porin [Erythrobacter dokdonensis]OBV11335.1 Gcw_chp domain-containing protein [Erythrobacter dokdonensis DSW-74]